VAEAIATVREASAQREDLHYLYIVDEAELLVGLVTLRRLLLASESTPVSRIMKQRSELRGIVTPEVDRERVALLMAEYNLPDIIVVDDEGYLLGEVTHDDVIDIIQREATEDLQKLVGAGGDEGVNDELSYSIRRRLPWLYVNLGSAALAATVVATFEHRIDLLPLLAVFMPIVASMGGNTGMQTLSVAIRGIALGEFQKADNRRILIKELGAGIFNGLAVGLSTGLIVYLWKGDIVLASVLTLALIATMGLAGLAGATIPILLRRFNLDPAQSSSIFLTTVTDVVGFLIFLSLGSWMLL